MHALQKHIMLADEESAAARAEATAARADAAMARADAASMHKVHLDPQTVQRPALSRYHRCCLHVPHAQFRAADMLSKSLYMTQLHLSCFMV
jgi:hypothetical protein